MGGADPGNAQHALFGDQIFAGVGLVISGEVGVGRGGDIGEELRGRDQRDIGLARFHQHRGIRRRHADRDTGIGRGLLDHQPLEQSARQQFAKVGVGQFLLGEERLVGRLADLAVEPAGRLDLGDFGIDQPLRQRHPLIVGEGADRGVLHQQGQQRIEILGQRGVIGLRVRLADLGQAALEGVADVAIGHFLAADLDQCAAAHAAARNDVADVLHRESGDQEDPEQQQDDGANGRFRHFADEG